MQYNPADFPAPLRALRTTYVGWRPGAAPEHYPDWVSAAPLVPTKVMGWVFVDGSCQHPKSTVLARAGWSFVMVDEDGAPVAGAYEAVPADSKPTEEVNASR